MGKRVLTIIIVILNAFVFSTLSYAKFFSTGNKNIPPQVSLKVVSHNLGTNRVLLDPDHKIVLTFSHDIKIDEDTEITITDGMDDISTQNSITGRALTIDGTSPFLYSKSYTLTVKGVKDIGETLPFSPYSVNFRLIKFEPEIVGNSYRGLPIYAYYIGEGSKTILFFGAIHGNEKNNTSILQKFLLDLDTKSDQIPSDKRIIIIPVINIDGYLRNSRLNARGVDLNRNYQTRDWQRITYIGGLKLFYGGGHYPLSEPETRIITQTIEKYNPYLSVSYHCAANYVIPSGTSTRALASEYAKRSGYSYNLGGPQGFSYTITGDFNVWNSENMRKSLIIETKTCNGDEFSRNLSAMWYLVNY